MSWEENRRCVRKIISSRVPWHSHAILCCLIFDEETFPNLSLHYHCFSPSLCISLSCSQILSPFNNDHLSIHSSPNLYFSVVYFFYCLVALQQLQKGKMISQLLKACATLELSTQLSKKCSEAFAKSGASKILFALIRSCNRSTPHQELLRWVRYAW